jgi:hypothetical protein
MDGVPGFAFDRRAMLRGAILLVGGTVAGLPDLALAQADAAPFFTRPERALLDAICATMIPKTDTPGAIEAGVPGFIDAMMTHWASANTQGQFRAVLVAIDKAAGGFVALDADGRTAALAAFDGFALGRWDPDYLRFKQLVLTGYYLSEPGATQELRYELVPGVWEPATPMTPDTRAWAVG